MLGLGGFFLGCGCFLKKAWIEMLGLDRSLLGAVWGSRNGIFDLICLGGADLISTLLEVQAVE